MKPIGSRIQVFAGLAVRTSGGLTKQKLAKNKHGKIVSKKKQGQQSNLARFLTGKPKAPKFAPPPPKPKPKAVPKKPKPAPPPPKPKPKAKPKPKPKPPPPPKPIATIRRSGRVRKKPKRLGF